MKASDIYRKAAERVDGLPNHPSCVAISEAVCGKPFDSDGYGWICVERFEYGKLFDIDPRSSCREIDILPVDERRQFRVLLLLLMSEISRGEK